MTVTQAAFCLPGWPECSGRTGNRRRHSWISDAVVEKSKAFAGDAVDVPGWLSERVRTADSYHDRQGGPEQAHVDRDPATRRTTTHVGWSTDFDVSRSSIRSGAITALRRTVARHRGKETPQITSQLRQETPVNDVIRQNGVPDASSKGKQNIRASVAAKTSVFFYFTAVFF